jgi:hypothetical protein
MNEKIAVTWLSKQFKFEITKNFFKLFTSYLVNFF